GEGVQGNGAVEPVTGYNPGLFTSEQSVGAWRSLVAHLHGVQGVPSSNLGAPISISEHPVFSVWTPSWTPRKKGGAIRRRTKIAAGQPCSAGSRVPARGTLTSTKSRATKTDISR